MATIGTVIVLTIKETTSLTEQERFIPGNDQDLAHGANVLINEIKRFASGNSSGTLQVTTDFAKTRTWTK